MEYPQRASEQSVSARRHRGLLFVHRSLFSTAIAIPMMLAAGCYSRPGPPEPTEGKFQACPVAIGSSGSTHVVQATVGSPGYALELDSMWDAYRRKHVFVTVRKPDPRYAYPQVVVDLSLLTQVDTTDPITVFARLADHDETEPEDEYRQAASAEGTGMPPRDSRR